MHPAPGNGDSQPHPSRTPPPQEGCYFNHARMEMVRTRSCMRTRVWEGDALTGTSESSKPPPTLPIPWALNPTHPALTTPPSPPTRQVIKALYVHREELGSTKARAPRGAGRGGRLRRGLPVAGGAGDHGGGGRAVGIALDCARPCLHPITSQPLRLWRTSSFACLTAPRTWPRRPRRCGA